MKRLVIRFGLLALVIVGVVIWNPNLIRTTPLFATATGLHNQAFQTSWVNETAKKAQSIDWQGLLAQVKQINLPSNPFTGEKKEVSVEAAVQSLTNQVKTLPQEKAHEVKTNFCQDIVAESRNPGKVAGANDSN